MKNKPIPIRGFLDAKRLPAYSALILGFAASVMAAPRHVLTGTVPRDIRVLNLQPVGRLSSTNRLQLTVGLPLRNQAALSSLLQQLYNPTSPKFHQYLTPEKFTAMFGPTEQDYRAAINFARTNGIEVVAMHGNRVVIDVSGKVSDIERAFHVALRTYQHPTEGRQFFAPDVEPSVDTGVPILDISGLSNYALPRPMAHRNAAPQTATMGSGSGPDGYFIGSDFRNAYVPGVTLNGSGQMVGLVELSGYFASDITAYEQQAGLPMPYVPIQNVIMPGFDGTPTSCNCPDYSCQDSDESEVALDIEMVIAMAPNLAGVVVFEGSSGNSILASMVASNQIKQFSSSWALSSSPNATGEELLQQMAAQGQSFFQASGDGDAWIVQMPWPCDDPYATSVGGTELAMNGSGASYNSETVWNVGSLANGWCCNPSPANTYWGSGGGTSTVYSIPSWQQGVNMSLNGGSTTMRNIPDVSMVADKVWSIWDNANCSGLTYGTSCAAPLWAGFMALVNQQAAINGQSSVGFLNPAIYALGESLNYDASFHDYIPGNSEWPGSTNRYSAVTLGGNGYYDLCTGWGTPTANLINALLTSVVWVDFHYTGTTQNGSYEYPFPTMARAVAAVSAGGAIWIKSTGSSPETPTISKPLTIRAYNGAATIGH